MGGELTRVRKFAAPTSGATVDLTSSGMGTPLGYEILACIAVSDYDVSTANGVDDVALCKGFYANGKEGYCAIVSEDGGSETNTKRVQDDDAVVRLIDPAGTTLLKLSHNSFVTDGIRLNVDTAGASGYALVVRFYLVGEGDLIDHAPSGTINGTSTDSLSFTPDMLKPLSCFAANDGTPVDDFSISRGFVAVDKDGALAQSCGSWRHVDAIDVGLVGTDPRLLVSATRGLYEIGTTAELEFEILTDSFRTTTRVAVFTPGTRVFVFCWDFQGEALVKAGTFQSSTSSGVQSHPEADFEPQDVSIVATASTGAGTMVTGAAAGGYGFGEFTDDAEHVVAAIDRDNRTTVESGSFWATNAYRVVLAPFGAGIEADFDGFDADGWDWNYVNPGAIARTIPFLAISLGAPKELSLASAGSASSALSPVRAVAANAAGVSASASALAGTRSVALGPAGTATAPSAVAGRVARHIWPVSLGPAPSASAAIRELALPVRSSGMSISPLILARTATLTLGSAAPAGSALAAARVLDLLPVSRSPAASALSPTRSISLALASASSASSPLLPAVVRALPLSSASPAASPAVGARGIVIVLASVSPATSSLAEEAAPFLVLGASVAASGGAAVFMDVRVACPVVTTIVDQAALLGVQAAIGAGGPAGVDLVVIERAGSYAPSTARVTPSPTEHTVRSSPALAFAESLVDGSLVRAGDVRFVFQAEGIGFDPALSDRVRLGGFEAPVVAVQRIVASGLDAAWVLQVRDLRLPTSGAASNVLDRLVPGVVTDVVARFGRNVLFRLEPDAWYVPATARRERGGYRDVCVPAVWSRIHRAGNRRPASPSREARAGEVHRRHRSRLVLRGDPGFLPSQGMRVLPDGEGGPAWRVTGARAVSTGLVVAAWVLDLER